MLSRKEVINNRNKFSLENPRSKQFGGLRCVCCGRPDIKEKYRFNKDGIRCDLCMLELEPKTEREMREIIIKLYNIWNQIYSLPSNIVEEKICSWKKCVEEESFLNKELFLELFDSMTDSCEHSQVYHNGFYTMNIFSRTHPLFCPTAMEILQKLKITIG